MASKNSNPSIIPESGSLYINSLRQEYRSRIRDLKKRHKKCDNFADRTQIEFKIARLREELAKQIRDSDLLV